MELSTQNLVRRLCSNLANEAVSDPQHADKLSAKLFDTAFSNLLGLNLVGTTVCVPYPTPRAGELRNALGQLRAGR